MRKYHEYHHSEMGGGIFIPIFKKGKVKDMGMTFKEAFGVMKKGGKVKLPSWGGYWCWDAEKDTIMIHTKDREELDIRETQMVEYTTINILSEDWQIADSRNCPELGGQAMFSFSDAIRYLKRGLRVARKGWNGKGMWLCLACGVAEAPQSDISLYESVTGFLPWIGMKTADNSFVPWLASQTDILAEDWVFAD